METMGKTKRRADKSDETHLTKKKRKSTVDIKPLENKAEQEMALRSDEMFSADNNAAGNVKDDSEAATKKSNATDAIY